VNTAETAMGLDGALTGKSALILGGGKGSRIGYDKKTLELHGVPVLDTLVAKLSPLFPEVLISSNNPVAIPFTKSRITIVPDILGAGPLAGIYAGLCACSGDYLFVCACDMPFINVDFIRYVDALIAEDAACGEPQDIYICRVPPKPGGKSSGYEPFNAFYRKTVTQSARLALEKGEYKLFTLIEHSSRHIIGEEEIARFGGDRIFFNINRPEDLRDAARLDTVNSKPG
jgi:molybdopterin-guanine dinucleotide biosynthesis protein A